MRASEGTVCRHNGVSSWYTIYCKPQREALTAGLLADWLSLTVYLPELCQVFHGRVYRKPCFPRYLFVQVDLQETPFHALMSIPGVIRLVGFDAGPQVVPGAVVETIRHQVEHLNRRVTHPEAPPFRPGEAVRLRNGPLQSLEEIFDESVAPGKRVKALIALLGQLSRTEGDGAALELARPPQQTRPPRRTRGRGR